MRFRAAGRRWVAGVSLLALTGLLALLGYSLTHPSNPGFASRTAYLDKPPPIPRDAVRVASSSSFEHALAKAHAGETILVTGHLRIAGEFSGFDRVIKGGIVKVVLGPGVRFVGGDGKGLPAVWVRRSGGWRIWGGTITNREGGGLLFYSLPGPLTWTGFRVRDTAGGCVGVLPVGGNIDHLVLEGLTGTAKPNLSLDPHAEKGTGIQAWNIADATGGVVEQSTFAADVVDQATGAAVEIDTGRIGPGVAVYARARHLGFALPGTSWNGNARAQVAGNVIQLWGATLKGTLDLRYVEGADINGRLLDTTGVHPGADLSRVRVDLARVSGPILQNPLLSGPAVSAADGIQVDRLSQELTVPSRNGGQ
jgi:hypothetical protein